MSVLVLIATLTGIVASGWRAPSAVARSGGAPGSVVRTPVRTRAAAPDARSPHPASGAPSVDAPASAPDVRPADPGALPQLAGTYLADMVVHGGAARTRWDDRRASPVRVWLAPGDTLSGWQPSFGDVVRSAFAAWERVVLPVRFAFTDVPQDADVHVTWTERLPEARAGVAHWMTGADGWFARVALVLATRVSDGTPADEASVYRIALHEIGHLLGLGHSTAPRDVMAPWVTAGSLSGRDLATARLLYSLTPGQIADAGRVDPPASAARATATQ
jgi:hypothetical protein